MADIFDQVLDITELERLADEQLLEWTDPETGKVHKAPKKFAEIKSHLGTGKRNSKLASQLLEAIGEEVNDDNERHIRKVTQYLRLVCRIPVLGVRSAKGGYYIAETKEEIKTEYTNLQRKLAASMLRTCDLLESLL
jgi:hypothetical protein